MNRFSTTSWAVALAALLWLSGAASAEEPAGGATIAHEFGDDSFVPTMLVTAGFEAVEPVINPWWDESLVNQRCDVVFNTLGWLIQSLAK